MNRPKTTMFCATVSAVFIGEIIVTALTGWKPSVERELGALIIIAAYWIIDAIEAPN